MIGVGFFQPLIQKHVRAVVQLLVVGLLLHINHHAVSAFLRSSCNIRRQPAKFGGSIFMIKSYLDTLSKEPSNANNLSYLDTLSSNPIRSNPLDVAAAADESPTKVEAIITETKLYSPLGTTEDPSKKNGETSPDDNRSIMGSYLDSLSSRTSAATEPKVTLGTSEDPLTKKSNAIDTKLSTIVTIKGVPDGEIESIPAKKSNEVSPKMGTSVAKGSKSSASAAKSSTNAVKKAKKSPKGKSDEKKARMSALAFPDDVKKAVTTGYFLYVLAFGSAVALQVAIQSYPEEWASFVSRTYTSIDSVTPANLKDLRADLEGLRRDLSEVTMESATITALETLRSGLILEDGVVKAKTKNFGSPNDGSGSTVQPSLETKSEGTTVEAMGENIYKAESKNVVTEGTAESLININPEDLNREITVEAAIQKFLKGLFTGEVTVESATKVENAIEEFLKTLKTSEVTEELTVDGNAEYSETGIIVESQGGDIGEGSPADNGPRDTAGFGTTEVTEELDTSVNAADSRTEFIIEPELNTIITEDDQSSPSIGSNTEGIVEESLAEEPSSGTEATEELDSITNTADSTSIIVEPELDTMFLEDKLSSPVKEGEARGIEVGAIAGGSGATEVTEELNSNTDTEDLRTSILIEPELDATNNKVGEESLAGDTSFGVESSEKKEIAGKFAASTDAASASFEESKTAVDVEAPSNFEDSQKSSLRDNIVDDDSLIYF